MPSNVLSVMYLFLKTIDPPLAVIGIGGEIRLDSPTVAGSFVNAAFRGVSGVVMVVTHSAGGPAPVFVVVHPAGNAGATTPSKF
jgi:hypothetical protein